MIFCNILSRQSSDNYKNKTMKKLMTVSAAILICFAANANGNALVIDEPMLQVFAAIFVVGMFMYFIINVLKRILEHRLKNKIIDKGISENIAQSILETKVKEDSRHMNIKWFAILAGIGIGLLSVYYTEPLGIHSLAIMAFSISLSFLGYYFFTRNLDK